MSIIKKAHWKNNSYRKKQIKASFKRWQDPEFKKRMSWKTRESNPAWKGGRWISKYGYVFILMPDHPRANSAGYIQEHRIVVESQIGRYLLPNEKVHHIQDKDDNRPNNLMAFSSHSAHRRFECGKKIDPNDIIFDGRLLSHSHK
jgi:hypothetical protein